MLVSSGARRGVCTRHANDVVAALHHAGKHRKALEFSLKPTASRASALRPSWGRRCLKTDKKGEDDAVLSRKLFKRTTLAIARAVRATEDMQRAN